jgi:hypothetical protein
MAGLTYYLLQFALGKGVHPWGELFPGPSVLPIKFSLFFPNPLCIISLTISILRFLLELSVPHILLFSGIYIHKAAKAGLCSRHAVCLSVCLSVTRLLAPLPLSFNLLTPEFFKFF